MTSPKQSAATPKERSWIPILVAWKRSGLVAREFCRRRRLSESAFWYWKRELPDRERRRQETGTPGRGQPAFRILPVRVVEKSRPMVPLEILSGGRTLRIPGDFDPALLRKVLSVLEGPP